MAHYFLITLHAANLSVRLPQKIHNCFYSVNYVFTRLMSKHEAPEVLRSGSHLKGGRPGVNLSTSTPRDGRAAVRSFDKILECITENPLPATGSCILCVIFFPVSNTRKVLLVYFVKEKTTNKKLRSSSPGFPNVSERSLHLKPAEDEAFSESAAVTGRSYRPFCSGMVTMTTITTEAGRSAGCLQESYCAL